jgi:hypothetical protein
VIYRELRTKYGKSNIINVTKSKCAVMESQSRNNINRLTMFLYLRLEYPRVKLNLTTLQTEPHALVLQNDKIKIVSTSYSRSTPFSVTIK